MYAYYWLYTAAEIQLMTIDQPMVVYNHDKKEKQEFKKQNALSVLKAQKKWEENKRKQGDKPIVFDLSKFGKKNG